MKTKLIIVEGLDNTGKTTLVNRLNTVLTNLNNKVHIIHLEKPPKTVKDEDIVSYTKTYYDTIISQLTDPKIYNLYDYIIIDRCHLSEYVYGPIYRHRDKLDIVEDNLLYEYKLFDKYKNLNIKNSNIFLFLLMSDDNDFLINHDDNKSLSNCDHSKINAEREEFYKAYEMSLIDNKYIFYVNYYTEYKDILPDVFKILYNLYNKTH